MGVNVGYGKVICPKCGLDNTSEKIVYYGGDLAYCKKCKSTFSIVLLTNTPEIKSDDLDYVKCPNCTFPAYRISGKRNYNCQKCKSTFINEEVGKFEKSADVSNKFIFTNNEQRKDIEPMKTYTDTMKQQPQKKAHPIFGLISLGIVIFCIVSFNKSCDDSKSSSSSTNNGQITQPDKTAAFVIAENFVKASLKSPSTSDFGSVFETADAIEAVSRSGNTFTVNWHVDAQNSYGAKLRSNYTCRLTYNGGDIDNVNNWTCNYLNVDGVNISGNNSTNEQVSAPTPPTQTTINSPDVSTNNHTLHTPIEMTVKKDSLTKVEYEILSKPNGGLGVFDFIYNVYLNKKPTNAACNYIFNDIISRFGYQQIDNRRVMNISIWTNKAAFFKELAVYKQEDRDMDAGKNIRKYGKIILDLENKYGKYEVAAYTDDGSNPVTITYPEDK